MARQNTSPFGPGMLRFLRELEANNNRAWFSDNKERYEAEVREPAIAFIRAMAPNLGRISKQLTASDRKVGGSLMRVYRDTRFSKDKTPYKTNVGIQFRHLAGKDVHAPGLYLHVDNSGVFLASGMWRPSAEALAAVRKAIDDDQKGWKRVRDAKRFREDWQLAGSSLKRPPRGFDKDHPLVEDLKRTDHIAVCELKRSDVAKDGFIEQVTERFGRSKGYLSWLAKAVGMPF